MTHDQTTPAPVEVTDHMENVLHMVTPKDREAYLAINMLPEKYAADVRAGRWDGTTGMQVLARHRGEAVADLEAKVKRLQIDVAGYRGLAQRNSDLAKMYHAQLKDFRTKYAIASGDPA